MTHQLEPGGIFLYSAGRGYESSRRRPAPLPWVCRPSISLVTGLGQGSEPDWGWAVSDRADPNELQHLFARLGDAERDELLLRLVGAAAHGGDAMIEVLEQTLLRCATGRSGGATVGAGDSAGFSELPEDQMCCGGDCDFCTMPALRIVAENELAYAVRDTHPVSPLHTLVIPKRHVASYFALRAAERRAVEQLIDLVHDDILESDPTVLGFNVGVNQGEVAGQSIFHCHIHVIPRRAGDDPKPRGGVRKAVRGKGDYPSG